MAMAQRRHSSNAQGFAGYRGMWNGMPFQQQYPFQQLQQPQPQQQRQPRNHRQQLRQQRAVMAEKDQAQKTQQQQQNTRQSQQAAAERKECTWRPTSEQVMTAVHSLYADGLKPYGRLLLKRVRELAAVEAGLDDMDVDSVPRLDPKVLRAIATDCSELDVQQEDGHEYSVYLVNHPHTFVDVSSLEDNYPSELWENAHEYFQGLSGDEALLPGGRYACAKLLTARKLDFLASRCLGEICHIVQLSISQKKLLGYLDGNMVPYDRSEERIKESCAILQQPVHSTKRSMQNLPHATWAQARHCLREILQQKSNGEGPGAVTLSNVKRLFRSRYSLELSETVLGYPRLYELLQDPHFSDICCVQLQSNGQVVVQEVPSSSPVPRIDGMHKRTMSEESTEPPTTPSSSSQDDLVCLSTIPFGQQGHQPPTPTGVLAMGHMGYAPEGSPMGSEGGIMWQLVEVPTMVHMDYGWCQGVEQQIYTPQGFQVCHEASQGYLVQHEASASTALSEEQLLLEIPTCSTPPPETWDYTPPQQPLPDFSAAWNNAFGAAM